MERKSPPLSASVQAYLASRPRLTRGLEWLSGRRYRLAALGGRSPVAVIAHSWRDERSARQVALALEEEWTRVPESCRSAYTEILLLAPQLIVVQVRRDNVCGCLAHRHVLVTEKSFAEPHEAFGGAPVGEMDIAVRRVEAWQALPLTDTAFDARFLAGSRLEEFRHRQFRLKLLSILLHETNHLVFPHEPESSVRERSLAFYRAALADYVANTIQTLSLTIDRSFSRFG
ncbi:MAG TPA: hypothetical protein VKM93_17320 [Terriglobia bacterium]|nr:hypothetical protein [Terriglobia bacterium]